MLHEEEYSCTSMRRRGQPENITGFRDYQNVLEESRRSIASYFAAFSADVTAPFAFHNTPADSRTIMRTGSSNTCAKASLLVGFSPQSQNGSDYMQDVLSDLEIPAAKIANMTDCLILNWHSTEAAKTQMATQYLTLSSLRVDPTFGRATAQAHLVLSQAPGPTLDSPISSCSHRRRAQQQQQQHLLLRTRMRAKPFPTWLIVATTVACIASAAPSENGHEHSQESSEEGNIHLEKFCPGETEDCLEKAKSLREVPPTKFRGARRAGMEKWKRSHDACRKKYERDSNIVPGEADPMIGSEIRRCALEMMEYIVDGEINRAIIRSEVEDSLSDAPNAVRKAVLSAVDTCPSTINEDNGYGYTVCLMKACLSAV
ncbi:uncharacterized protein LOC135209901 [Macrobrachium nipponense]|uniref:uncharacterized protein LOC135209901 n=1 Tax=Macrobrachium nipponense TaxID=159736 RepID=UPI0030C7C6D3